MSINPEIAGPALEKSHADEIQYAALVKAAIRGPRRFIPVSMAAQAIVRTAPVGSRVHAGALRRRRARTGDLAGAACAGRSRRQQRPVAGEQTPEAFNLLRREDAGRRRFDSVTIQERGSEPSTVGTARGA